jgi:heat shock 70kDa protein 1/2/6/8
LFSQRGLPGSALIRLRQACEQMKINLSSKMEDKLKIDTDFSFTLTRANFENICSDLFSKINECVKTVFKEANLTKIKIDDVLMVGGSTKMPKIRSLLEFNTNKFNFTDDCSVVRGAAIQAAILIDNHNSYVKNIHVSDIISKSLGTPIQCGLLMNIIPKNFKIPHEYSMDLSTVGSKTQLSLLIYESEKDFTNTVIRECVIDSSVDRKIPQKFQVKLVVNHNGICELSATDNLESRVNQLRMAVKQRNLSASDLKRMMDEAMAFCRFEENLRRSRLACSAFSDYLMHWKQAIGDEHSSYNDRYKISLQQELSTEWEWLQANKNVDAEILEKRLENVKINCENTLKEMVANLPFWLSNLFIIERRK